MSEADEPEVAREPGWGAAWSSLMGRLVERMQEREESAVWFAQWLPVVAAAGRLRETAWTLAQTLAKGDVIDRLEAVDWGELREELGDLVDALPDAGHVLMGPGLVDPWIDDVLEDATARERAQALASWAEGLVDGLLKQLLEVWLAPGLRGRSASVAVEALEQVEAVLQWLVDRLLDRVMPGG